ncbi:YitT family protein [Desulfohalovibrio reitneri]|uniref:YitT family protein n=1 Tax=Desulfohalovibrio reitneri TaxID=1307759 RepID=UPI0004A6FD33|nr:YitT family protein [Desulfohalovibrio reitneri]
MRLYGSVRKQLSLPRWRRVTRTIAQQVCIAFGAALAALGYVLFQLPFNLAAGGMSGLGIIVNHYSGFPPGLFFLLSNVPLFAVGYFFLGKWRFVWSSALAVVVFSLATDFISMQAPVIFETFPLTKDKLLSSIYAGLLYGIGTGIIYRYGGTIGGTSIPARIIYNVTGFPLSQSYLFTDGLIILLAGLVFSWETALLAFLTLLLIGMASDFVLEGTSQVRTIMIVTEHPRPIQSALVQKMKRGVTTWDVRGGYSGTERTLIYCTVLRSKVYDVKHIVGRLDPTAFMVVGLSQQTWGGYNAPKIGHLE